MCIRSICPGVNSVSTRRGRSSCSCASVGLASRTASAAVLGNLALRCGRALAGVSFTPSPNRQPPAKCGASRAVTTSCPRVAVASLVIGVLVAELGIEIVAGEHAPVQHTHSRRGHAAPTRETCSSARRGRTPRRGGRSARRRSRVRSWSTPWRPVVGDVLFNFISFQAHSSRSVVGLQPKRNFAGAKAALRTSSCVSTTTADAPVPRSSPSLTRTRAGTGMRGSCRHPGCRPRAPRPHVAATLLPARRWRRVDRARRPARTVVSTTLHRFPRRRGAQTKANKSS